MQAQRSEKKALSKLTLSNRECLLLSDVIGNSYAERNGDKSD